MSHSRDDDALARARARRTGESLPRAKAALRWAPRALAAEEIARRRAGIRATDTPRTPDASLAAFAAFMEDAAAALRATVRPSEDSVFKPRDKPAGDDDETP